MNSSWSSVTVNEIAAACGGVVVRGTGLRAVSGVSTDSRNLKFGELFFALSGLRFDGHAFVEKALSAGASGVVVRGDRAGSIGGEGTVIAVNDPLEALGSVARWWRGRHHLTVAAITGSAGKTTTKEMASLVFETLGPTLKTEGNLNNLIGVPLTLLRIQPKHELAVIEMGMNRPGEIAVLTKIAAPDLGLITNVGMAHLEGLGSLSGIALAKWELADGLRPGSPLVINGDDPELMRRVSETRRDVITFGLGEGNRFRALEVENLGVEGVRFLLVYCGKTYPVMLRAAGTHQVMNALAATALGVTAGASPERAVYALERFSPLKGRFAIHRPPGGFVLVDDSYNANPSSLKAALQSAAALVGMASRLLVGLGTMAELGDGTAAAHLDAGRFVAASGAARFWAMGVHASEMAEGAAQAGMQAEEISVSDSHRVMALSIKEAARPGDVVFIKGSRSAGMERVVAVLRETDVSG
ncbi:MAG: UDP-N-acetylmuramoyl-tripeptide--D-alanyl-D-alanine ligase [Desulfatiglandaceae bacterium]